MNNYRRPHTKTLLARLREEPRWLNILVGPRQTGKTTIVKQVLERIHRPSAHVAVDPPDPGTAPTASGLAPDPTWLTTETILTPVDRRDARWLVWEWEQARAAARKSENGFVLALDEIEKIPNWSETVKGLWDADRLDRLPLYVVLLMSAPFRMQRRLTDSLAGRFEIIYVEHWSFGEMAAAFDFDLDSYVYFGGYPGPARIVGDEPMWREFIRRSLVEPNIERDILALQRVDKPILLKRLFSLGSEYSGQILSYNKMLGQLQDAGNTTTLARYLDLLSMAGLITGLSKYTSRRYRLRASIPKFNVLNTALMSAHSDYAFEQARADRTFWGRLLESTVGAHLINTGRPEHRTYYWSDSGSKVDFVLEHGRKLVAFNVNSGRRRGSMSGLDAFRKSFPVKAAHIVGKGGIPISEFLLTPAREWFEES